ncbi:MAG: hypothetical protein ABIS12_09635 [Bacteroidia bacterium]
MSINTMKYFSLFVLAGLALNLHSEENSWEKMLKLYSSSTSYSMDFKVSMNVKDENQAVTYVGSIKKSGTNYYSSVQGTINIYGPKYWIMIQEKEKKIYYGLNDKETNNGLVMDQTQFFDSLSKKREKPVLKSKSASEEVYSYVMKEGIYASVDYYVGLSTDFLNKVVYNYRQIEDVSYEKVTITYSGVSVNQPITNSLFSEKTYMTQKGKQFIGAGHYIGYTVIELQTLIPEE